MNKIEFLYNKDKYQGIDSSKALSHYGILGQKWGQRRWQNADGTFNEAGKERYFGPSGITKKNKEEIGSLYTAGKKIKEIFTNNKRTNENGQEYDIRYQNPDGSLTLRGYDLLDHPKKFDNKINKDLYNQYKETKKKQTEQEHIEKENKENELKERVQKLDNEVVTDKFPESTNGLTDEEFDKIAKDLDTWKHDFYDGKADKHLNTLVADLGINALNKSRGYDDSEVGNNSDREWFMWEDQTIGLPEIAYLYVKGYSKDYIQGMLDYKYKMNSLSDEEYSQFEDKYPSTSFTLNEYHDGNSYINALFELKENQDQKIGSVNSKEDAKANKEAVKLLADLNDKNGTKRYETLQKLYNDPRFEEQRNNVDKAIKEKFKDDFDELEKTYGGFDEVENEYLALAGLNRALMEDGGKMEDISYMPRLYLYDDLNQGSLTGESIWAYDNGIEDSSERWSKIYNKENSTKDELINSLTSDGSYNSKVLNSLDDGTKKDIVDHVYNYKSVPSSYWTLYNAGDTSKSEYDSVKNTTLKEAREISKKLSSSCGSDASGWALLNKAVNNLNLGGKDYTELTQADWDRINAEINSLKR